ncbi:KAP family P-loop NTPase fold protein [Prevotella sp.]|uniref:KAP family P-loop NTPase fold protein n=1 Tax=Prevotella sp. TaxID=59823 RepID=UPI0025D80840|nr:P-loop NTPase fold protein [Prevotella sp.]
MWSDNETTQDLLGYQVHADLLRKIILNDAMLPISIGVFGNWGSGKSSLMLLLQQSLHEWEESHQNEHSIILQVYFNSWQFESYDSTKLTMIESILEALDKDINTRKDVFERADDLLARINFLKVGVFILKKAYDNLTPDWMKKWLPKKDDIDKITGKDKYNNLLEDVTKGNTSKFIATFRELFEDLVNDMGYKAVIVYVDDLDRCDPKRIIGCLEAVKLFVNVKKTAFVIGADERIIEYAISQHYPIQMKKEDISSPFSDYLEKLIQLPYKLPRLSDNEQETYITLLLCKNHLNEIHFNQIHQKYLEFRKTDKHSKYNIDDIKANIPENQNIDFYAVEYRLPIVPIIKQFLNGNPRQLKRFLNTLYVRQELAEVAGFRDIRPDVLTKIMVLEYNTLYNSRFEELYKLQNENGGVLPLEDVEQEAKTEEGIQNPQWKDNWSSDYLKQWLSSEPSLKDINLQNYFWVARDALKNEKPIASLVTSKVMLLFQRLCTLQTIVTMKRGLPGIINACDDSEKDMIIHLINDNLRKDPKSENCWRILNCDENNLLLSNNIDRIKLLFSNIRTENIDAKADVFFVRMQASSEEIRNYIDTLPKAKPLSRAIERRNQRQ